MSFLPLKRKKTFLLIFSRESDLWHGKYLKGFNHCAIAEVVTPELLFIIEPAQIGARTMLRSLPSTDEWCKYTVLEVETMPTGTSKLIKPLFQTCTTLCQYIAGINLHCFLAQTLYDKLTNKDERYLKRHGIWRVKKWV